MVDELIDDIIEGVLAREGGYSDNPDDNGGPTNMGITQAVARRNGWAGDMVDLPRELAAVIYQRRYIYDPHFDRVANMSTVIGVEVIDAGVLSGPVVAAKWLQRMLNVMNMGGRFYRDMVADGLVGDETMASLAAYINRRGAEGEAIMVRGLNHLQGEFMVRIAEKREANESFVYGWLKNRTH